MLLSTSVLENFKRWCDKNNILYKENKSRNLKVKVFDVSFTIEKTENGYEIDENSTLWVNYKTNFFIPGIPLRKNKIEKLLPSFDWKKYKFGRLFFNSHSNTWGLYGTYMENREIIFRKLCNLSKDRLIGAFGEDWEEMYWEQVYE